MRAIDRVEIGEADAHHGHRAVFGQGEGLVSGLVTPDSYWVDTLDAGKPRFLRERVARKEQMIVAMAVKKMSM